MKLNFGRKDRVEMAGSLNKLARGQLQEASEPAVSFGRGAGADCGQIPEPKEYYFISDFNSGIILLPRDSFKENKR